MKLMRVCIGKRNLIQTRAYLIRGFSAPNLLTRWFMVTTLVEPGTNTVTTLLVEPGINTVTTLVEPGTLSMVTSLVESDTNMVITLVEPGIW